jgi:maltose O-acetyltransferase
MKAWIINWLFFLLPQSRCFRFKVFLLRLLGGDVGSDVRLMSITIHGPTVSVGEGTFIGNETLFSGGKSYVRIGRNCDISSRVSILTGTHLIGSPSRAAGEGFCKDVFIGDGVWIGFGCIILPGVRIGNGSIVAAGSVVISDIRENSLVAGVPAKEKRLLYVK